MTGVRAILLVSLLLARAGFGGAQQDAAAREKFRLASSQMGGPVAAPLVVRLDRLADVDLPEGSRSFRTAMLRKLTGKIGSLTLKAQGKRVDYVTPEDFRTGVESMSQLARTGHVAACTETGAVILTGVVSGQMSMTDRMGTDFLRKAAKAGDMSACYLYAFSLYYGLGVQADRQEALKQLKTREEKLSATDKDYKRKKAANADRSWELRRLTEAQP